MTDIIYDKRRKKRQEDVNEIAVTILPDKKNYSEKTVFHSYSKDISVLGTRIKSDMMLPVNTSVNINMKLKTMYPMVTTSGRVKWIKQIDNKSYEAGIEFAHTSRDEILKLARYLSWHLRFSRFFSFHACFI
jgi:hypothetical protein